MRKFLYQYPLHSFLLTFFLSFFLFAQNSELVEFHMMRRTLLIGTFLAFLIFGSVLFLVKEKTKSGIITTFILFALFYYGVIYDFIESLYYKGYWPFSNIHRYTLVFVLVYVVLVTWFVNKKIVVGNKVNYFLNLLIIFLFLFNFSKVMYKTFFLKDLIEKSEPTTSIIAKKKYPNIYYLVLDGYANQKVLKKYYNYDNAQFIDFLRTKQFYVADSSFSNYYYTSYSLSSTLNMGYHNSDDANTNFLDKIRSNKVLEVLKATGYKTYRLQSGYSVTSGLNQIDSTITINALNEFERSILKYSICRLDDLFGFFPFYRLNSQIEKLNMLVDIQSSSPKFIFIHIVAPHPPFVFDENGNRAFSKKDGDNSWEPKQNYVNQLKYINKVAENFIESALAKDKSSVFILQSDHGPWITSRSASDVFESRSMILNAIKFPDTLNYDILYKNISSVNTFRAIFKTHIDSSYNLIPDEKKGKFDLFNSPTFKDKIIH